VGDNGKKHMTSFWVASVELGVDRKVSKWDVQEIKALESDSGLRIHGRLEDIAKKTGIYCRTKDDAINFGSYHWGIDRMAPRGSRMAQDASNG
jgi:hypothetical protein